MAVLEFALAAGGLACALAGAGLTVHDYKHGRSWHDIGRDPAFWAAAGLVLCQVLWIIRLT